MNTISGTKETIPAGQLKVLESIVVEFDEEYNPFITMRLTKRQQKKLVQIILDLPYFFFRILCLHYCCGYSYARIERTLKIKHSRGIIRYCQDRLTQQMNLPRPIREQDWRTALAQAMDIYPIPGE